MTVANNIAFPLRAAGVSRKRRQALIYQIAVRIEIDHLLNRLAANLSGGERQRVALARTFAVQQPITLLDEPVKASLEPTLRLRIREAVRQMHAAHGGVTLLITHEYDEAFALADKVLLLMPGDSHAIMTPSDAVRRPPSLAAAEFVDAGIVLPIHRIAARRLYVDEYSHVDLNGKCSDAILRAAHLFVRHGGWCITAEGGWEVASITVGGRVASLVVHPAKGDRRLSLNIAVAHDVALAAKRGDHIGISVRAEYLLAYGPSGEAIAE